MWYYISLHDVSVHLAYLVLRFVGDVIVGIEASTKSESDPLVLVPSPAASAGGSMVTVGIVEAKGEGGGGGGKATFP